MKTKDSQKSQKHCGRDVEIYRLCKVEGLSPLAIMEKFGISRVTLWRILTKFERENPQAAELMKRQGKDVTPEDYKKLLEELSSLKKALAEERLRADFYQEMVAYGEAVYGINLKKAGTK